MIRIRRSPNIPVVLTNEGAVQTVNLCNLFSSDPDAFRDGRRTFQFDPGIYAHPSVKAELKLMQHDKCCFCEAKVSHISSGDVEHFRPKAGFRQDERHRLERPGYYWLAYDWHNLLFCCELCNRRHKGNLFPVDNPAARARDHNGLAEQESALFINPAAEDPEQFISFREEIPIPLAANPRGDATIRALGLNRKDLNDDRLRHLIIIRLLIFLATSLPQTPEGTQAGDLVSRARGDPGEYAGMVRAELARNYPALMAELTGAPPGSGGA